MVQVNDDYYEDLTPETLAQIIGRLKNGVEVTPGPQIDRVNSAPEGGNATLVEPALFDGSRNGVRVLPNLPEPPPAPEPAPKPEPTPEATGHPDKPAPTNTDREEPSSKDVKE